MRKEVFSAILGKVAKLGRRLFRVLVSFVHLGWFGFIRRGLLDDYEQERGVPVNTKWPVWTGYGGCRGNRIRIAG